MEQLNTRIAAPNLSVSPADAPALDHAHDSDHAHHHDLHEPGTVERIVTLGGIIVPIVGLVAAMVLLWGGAFHWWTLALLAVGYLLSGLGITVGYHRLFTHKSFETNPVVKAFFGICGSMAVQGPILWWAAMHRSHHKHSDSHDDPHSPHGHGGGVWGGIKGFFHAHFGWLLTRRDVSIARYVPDLQSDRVLRTISALFPLWVLLGLLIPAAIGGLITMSWTGALLGFVWGGLVRVFLLHHVTWSINSVCHLWGSRPFGSHDHSRNNVLFGILGMGEGWHNNHHAFPTSARHGLKWWQFDASYLVIRGLEFVGLARRVRVPSQAHLERKLGGPRRQG